MSKISNVHAREILDSRGNPTVEVDVVTDDGFFGRAAVPSGASTGIHEALELRDGDFKRYMGKGVTKAVSNVNDIIAGKVKGLPVDEQQLLDKTMIEIDGTPNKSKLGANAILGVSMAAARAAAAAQNKPLYMHIASIYGGGFAGEIPLPMMNILNGGEHADNNVDIQEWLILPVGATSFKEALRMASEVFHNLKNVLRDMGHSTAVGDEGGFAPNLKSNQEVLDLIVKGIEKAGYKPGSDIAMAIDSAASSFYKDGVYRVSADGKDKMNAAELTAWYKKIISSYPIVSVEDGLAEDDWTGWSAMNEAIGDKVQIIGDDIFVTNPERLTRGIKENTANSILIKLNQIGSITETIECMKQAKSAGYTTVVSHRSGETCDSFIADFAVGTGAGQIKTGSISRSERISKYNQLMRIEEELGGKSVFKGKEALPR